MVEWKNPRPTSGELAVGLGALEKQTADSIEQLRMALAECTASIGELNTVTTKMQLSLLSVKDTVKSWKRSIWLIVSAATTTILGQIILDLWTMHKG